MNIDFVEIRRRITVPAYCEQRGIRLKRSGGTLIGPCPIHQEHNGQSFVVWGNDRWSCFGKCARGGDVIDLDRALSGGSVRESVQRLMGSLSPLVLPAAEPTQVSKTSHRSWQWSELLRDGSEAELAKLAATRNLAVDACRLAQTRGLLRFLDHREGVAWVITDQTRQNAVARLLAGCPWRNGAKAKTLPDSMAKRPIGIIESIPFPNVALVEGGPDLLAALDFVLECEATNDVAVVCMTSVNAAFQSGDLARLRGKAIRIFPHIDSPGWKAAIRWLDQLAPLSTDVDIADLRGLVKEDGSAVKDLNDLTSLAYDNWEPFRSDIDRLMIFDGREACRS